jgi:hypothetical protein
MKKSVIFAVVLAIALAFTFGSVYAGDKGPAEMVLKTEASKKPKPAFFPHAKHQEANTCADCHHSKDADGKQAAYAEGQKVEKCATCHNADMANVKLNSFKKAAHGRCKACHKEQNAAGNTKAPTKCTGCHKKDLK